MRKGTDLITLDTLIELRACKEGREFFAEHHPDGGEYQEVLNAACEHGRPDFASWLLRELGPTDDVLAVDEIKTDGSVVFAGKIVVGRSIKAGWSIEAGGSIEAGKSIKAGGWIKAGWSIEAGGWIKAGWSIEAGKSIKAGGWIKAGGSIKAGWSIEAGGSIEADEWIEAGGSIEADEWIKAGYDSGIYAGLKAKLSDKSNRTVTAKIKPDNLMCGEFAPLEDRHEN